MFVRNAIAFAGMPLPSSVCSGHDLNPLLSNNVRTLQNAP